MTIDEMHYRFSLEVNKVDTLANLNFLPAEKDEYINRGIWIFLKERYGINPQNRRGFETDQERIDNLRTLHVKSPELQAGITASLISGNLYKVDLSSLTYEYLFLTRISAVLTSNGCTKKVRVKNHQTDDIYDFFTKPDFDWGIVNVTYGKSNSSTTTNVEKGALYFDTDGAYTLSTIYIDYIKYPNRVFFSGYNHLDGQSSSGSAKIHCDIDAAFHDEIVRLAVLEAHKDIGDVAKLRLSSLQTELDK